MARHVALLGDSIFDNGAYINGAPDVAEQLREMLSRGDSVTLCAVDGDVSSMVCKQLASVPKDATHIVVSAGGNDILHHGALLSEPAASYAEVLETLANARDEFARAHRNMLAGIMARRLPVAVCTIYDANYDPPFGRIAKTAISIFNDAITRNVHATGCDLIDLRLVCTQPSDYANPIEPSEQGGMRIAAAVRRYLDAEVQMPEQTRVFC